MKLREKMIKYWNKFRSWHEDMIDEIMIKFNLDEYTTLWIAFFKGVFLTLLLQWIF